MESIKELQISSFAPIKPGSPKKPEKQQVCNTLKEGGIKSLK